MAEWHRSGGDGGEGIGEKQENGWGKGQRGRNCRSLTDYKFTPSEQRRMEGWWGWSRKSQRRGGGLTVERETRWKEKHNGENWGKTERNQIPTTKEERMERKQSNVDGKEDLKMNKNLLCAWIHATALHSPTNTCSPTLVQSPSPSVCMHMRKVCRCWDDSSDWQRIELPILIHLKRWDLSPLMSAG